MLEQLEKVLEKRTTVKYFDGNPIPNNIVTSIKKSVAQTPSCNNKYNFKVKALDQRLEHRKAKVDLHNYICTVSKRPVENINNEPVVRTPKSMQEALKWQEQGILFSQINGQVLAPILLIWYVSDNDPINNDYIDIGLSCWNSIVTAETLGVQTGFCACFDDEFLKQYFNLEGRPVVMLGFGFASSVIPNHEKHVDRQRPNWESIIS